MGGAGAGGEKALRGAGPGLLRDNYPGGVHAEHGVPDGPGLFDNLELDVRDAEMFFNILSRLTEGEGPVELNCEAFIEGCMRMKGQASSLDLQAVVYQNSVLIKSVHSLREEL